jgi:hypothetical protein
MGILNFSWGYSSAGRALAWHARGLRFDPAYLHQSKYSKNETLVVSTSPSSRGLGHRPFTAITGVRIPVGTPSRKRYAEVAQLVRVSACHAEGRGFEPRLPRQTPKTPDLRIWRFFLRNLLQPQINVALRQK